MFQPLSETYGVSPIPTYNSSLYEGRARSIGIPFFTPTSPLSVGMEEQSRPAGDNSLLEHYEDQSEGDNEEELPNQSSDGEYISDNSEYQNESDREDQVLQQHLKVSTQGNNLLMSELNVLQERRRNLQMVYHLFLWNQISKVHHTSNLPLPLWLKVRKVSKVSSHKDL